MPPNPDLTSAAVAVAASRALAGALRAALPQACVLCAAASGDALLCGACAAAMPRAERACPRCALATPDAAACGRCLSQPPPFDAACAAWRYDFPADRLVRAFKYGGRLALAEPLARALADAVLVRSAPLPDCVCAVPLARLRQRHRGFNQAQEIARRVATRLRLPLRAALVRTRETPAQAQLPLRERTRHVRDAFRATQPLEGLAVAIVDDVMTSGATLAAAARAARAAGAVRVEAWVVARTPKDRG
jgi:ComF family protein